MTSGARRVPVSRPRIRSVDDAGGDRRPRPVVALGVTINRVRVPLGLREGSTGNATLARSIPGRRSCLPSMGKARSDGRSRTRNVLDLLSERDRPRIRARVRGAWALRTPPTPNSSSKGSPPKFHAWLRASLVLGRVQAAAAGPTGPRSRRGRET
jgi:hypothetical protein